MSENKATGLNTQNEAEIYALLPQVIQEIADAIGLHEAIILAEAFMGTVVKIPIHMHEAHPIAKAIGIEAAQALQAVFIGEEVTFPMLTALHRQQRDIAIRADHDKGLTVNALAQKHRVSSRSIYLSLRRTKQPIATPKPRGRK